MQFFKEWFSVRGPVYIHQRAKNLLERYHISSSHAIKRIDECIKSLIDQSCYPTFPTPAIVVKRYPQYFRRLQDEGVEIAIHGYQHINLNTYLVSDACKQLAKAVSVFESNGINVHGFRCPYLGCTDELLDTLPKGLFEYSSNKAIFWNVLTTPDNNNKNLVFDTLCNLYKATPSIHAISVPLNRLKMVEIPVCMPDDMELLDGLNFTPSEIVHVWSQILVNTHKRGELFNLIFHPELASLCEQPLCDVMRRAKLLHPQVWVARLWDISEWWNEKAGFYVEINPSLIGLHLNFVCSPRATILVKGLKLNNSGCPWDGPYQRLLTRTLEVPASPRPFIGLSPKTPQKVISFLQEQGYILDTTKQATSCSIYLEETSLAAMGSEVQLIDYIEAFTGPLVRYWRWPNGAKSALSITGDLDALSLVDYLWRLY